MAGLCWMAVMLTVLLSAGDRADAVDLETLASYVNQISAMYGTHGTYSLARVKDKLDKDEVYVGTRVVASKFHEEGQHAESRVVDKLVTLFNNEMKTSLVPAKTSLPLNSYSLNKSEGVPPHKGEAVEAGRFAGGGKHG
ncbi:hypothetical protein KUCAC02_015459 [Chaenocephalus aceratus]|uniref:Uncharacterized protein n=1 Tax=Chaenocephalus aceratus TaxID=36190 RepID=A0ACB9XZD5_CHAAC|nr:hypothetical protein KUCAC02_015459 [Chaenocephalus aceratus]